jgi:pyruvate dehydrogenase E2 component (dihydrolipoamide acetyltransferase)
MAEIATMPKLGFDMAEGTLVRWVAGEGEKVDKGAILAEIETDKATVEVESQFSGVVARHLVKEGDAVPVGEPIAVIGQEGEQIDFDKILGEVAPEAETGLRPDAPTADAEAAPRPSTVEQPEAPAAAGGQPAEGAVAPTTARGGRDGDGAAAGAPPAQAAPAASAPASPEEEEGGPFPDGVKASPLARRMAADKGLDLRQIQGSGPGGRITKTDIENYQPAPAPAPAAAEAPAPGAPAPQPQPRPVPITYGAPLEERRIPVTRLRAAVGRRMVSSKQQIPHFYVTHEYNMSAVMELRKQVNEMLPEGEKTSVNDYIVKAVALALREFPNLNASLDEKTNEIVHHGHINIGNAVAVEGGLLTVVTRDADLKPIRMISREVKEMAERARQGKVRPDDIEGSTFSISNMGMYNVEHFIAVINPPEAGILAVGTAQEVPVVENGKLKVGLRMKATISIDHRVSDGAEAARFMQALEKYLQAPMLMMVS